jgi:Flp pilus assembly protein TadD
MDRSARDLFNKGKLDEAARAYRKILETSPENAHALANLATILARQNHGKEALHLASRAAGAQPADAFSRITLGSIQHALGQDTEALGTLACAATLEPSNPEVRLYLGVAASGLKWTALAERQFLEAIRLDPDYAEAHRNLAVLYATANPPLLDRARKHLEKAKALGVPPDPQLDRLLE